MELTSQQSKKSAAAAFRVGHGQDLLSWQTQMSASDGKARSPCTDTDSMNFTMCQKSGFTAGTIIQKECLCSTYLLYCIQQNMPWWGIKYEMDLDCHIVDLWKAGQLQLRYMPDSLVFYFALEYPQMPPPLLAVKMLPILQSPGQEEPAHTFDAYLTWFHSQQIHLVAHKNHLLLR